MPALQNKTISLGADKNASGQDIYKSIKSDVKQPIAETEFFPISQNFVFKAKNWNKLLPYRLVILTASEKKVSVPLNKGSQSDSTEYKILSSIYSSPGAGSVQPIFTLPIAPQNLSIETNFANQTTVLSDGILVENNGAPLRMITIAGTTGVVPFRELGAESYDSSIAGELVGNTIRSAKAVGRQAQNIKKQLQSVGGIGGNTNSPEMDNTGFAQFHKLKDFLDLWSNLSKRPENKNLRLALDLAKDDTTYLVTPKRFALQRSADSPLEYKYIIQLEAWKRIKINGSANNPLEKDLAEGVFENIGKIQSVIQALQGVRKLLQQVANIGNAIRSDFAKLVNMVREIILIAKDLAGIAKTIIDLPTDLILAAKGPILSAVADVEGAWKEVEKKYNQFPKNFVNALLGEVNQGTANAQGVQTSSSLLSTNDQSGSGGANVSPSRPGPAAGSSSQLASSTPLLDKILLNPNFGSLLLDAVPLDLLNIPRNLQDKIDDEIFRVKTYTRTNFVEMKTFVEQFSRDCAVAFGLGDETVDTTFNYYSINYPSSTRTPSRQEMDLLNALRKFVSILDEFTAFEVAGDNSITESFNFIGNLAETADLGLNVSESVGKIAVPVIYEQSLEEMAQYYLGSADRALEIALLNGLTPPFIDEDGTEQLLLSNGTGNNISINDASNLYIGQKLILSSTIVVPFSRYIIDIKRLNNNNYLITLDGNNNLDVLKVANDAKILYFARGTVSSRNTIFIPSNFTPSNIPKRLRPLPYYFQDIDGLAKFTGVDLALGSNNDVVLSKSGKVVLVGGLANLQQALKLKFLTPKGSLIRHPSYGSGIQPGTAVADVSADDIRDQAISTIMSDYRFGEVAFINVSLEGPIIRLNGGVTVNSNNSVLPFAFRISP